MDTQQSAAVIFVCPACKSALQCTSAQYRCIACAKIFPILFGIPDFRLHPDPYLSIAAERDKAARLHAFASEHTFRELLVEYYRITDDVPIAQAKRFAAYAERGISRGETFYRSLGVPAHAKLLDCGSATGGFLISATRHGNVVVGVDIALRWLVICAKRLQEEGLNVTLVCADVRFLPFPAKSFDAVVAADLFEHLRVPQDGMRELNQVMHNGGKLLVTGANRYTLTAYPLVGLWGVGYLPQSVRRWYVEARKGIDMLRYATLHSPGSMKKVLEEVGFECLNFAPLSVPRAVARSRAQRCLLSIYTFLRRCWMTKRVLLLLGPAFEVLVQKPTGDKG